MDQKYKFDAGKLRISLVPPKTLWAIAKVREFGVRKYGARESWREVEPQRYFDAMLRHTMHCMEDILAVDEESGLPALWHVLTNAAFLTELLWADSLAHTWEKARREMEVDGGR